MQDNIDFVNFDWHKDYDQYVKFINKFALQSLSQFSAKLTPTKYKILGIPVPVMKMIAKQICLGDIQQYLDVSLTKMSFEEVMIYGMVVAISKIDDDIKIKYLTKWSGIIDNWAHTDCVGAMLKNVKHKQNKYIDFIAELLVSEQEFRIRLAIVLLLDYYLDDNYVDYAISQVSKIDDNQYYISMAIAWFISILFVKYKDKAIELLNNNTFNTQTINRAVQKIRDSLRVSPQDKQYVLQFKK